ncbi:MAG TPA: hypothetical protein P5186_09090 [Candidatus Paceibacterota bacterium]|nr:hypothetical protein [Verrucomicrobiota bacterium]HRY48189.1 hypothetical protein [Candidatus Paceibacterota bacterium]
MEFDWTNPPFELNGGLTMRDIEESFEDPFAVRLMPDSSRFSVQARFFNLGKSASGVGIFSVYRTNGKFVRVLFARHFEADEQFFYHRKLNQALAQ